MNKQAFCKVRDCLLGTIDSLQQVRSGLPNGTEYGQMAEFENDLHEKVKAVSRIINSLEVS